MVAWAVSIYSLVTAVIFFSGLMAYQPVKPVPSKFNRIPARRILLCWAWPICVAHSVALWWIRTFERVWIDAQWKQPQWVIAAKRSLNQAFKDKRNHDK